MRKPRPEAFDPQVKGRAPDPINMAGIVPLTIQPTTPQSIFSAPSANSKNSEPVVSRYHGIKNESPSAFDTTDLTQSIRKAVKEFGKEAATHRFTIAEKKALAEMIYDYRLKGIRTSENEIARIAINYLFYEYQQRRDQSILHHLLIALNA